MCCKFTNVEVVVFKIVEIRAKRNRILFSEPPCTIDVLCCYFEKKNYKFYDLDCMFKPSLYLKNSTIKHAQNAPDCTDLQQIFKIFPGEHAPGPP